MWLLFYALKKRINNLNAPIFFESTSYIIFVIIYYFIKSYIKFSILKLFTLGDDNEPDGEEINVIEGIVHYGQTIKLVCVKTNLATPMMVKKFTVLFACFF